MNEVNGIASAIHKRKFCPKCGESMKRTFLRSDKYNDYYAYCCENCNDSKILVQRELKI